MSVFYNVIIEPLQLLFEFVFALANRFFENPGFSIIFLSLAMNLLVWPLYKRTDLIQEEQRKIEKKLKPGVDHIKKTFKGDERFMMLQTYYRQNNYKVFDSLKGMVSLLLEIPFFIAAYNMISGLELLQGVSFGPIKDLGKPDQMFMIGTFAVNVLPILMTVINIISSAIYSSGMSKQSKIQLYGMATLFLVLLYTSPAGVVFYWTLNNLFSLIKNICYKLKDINFAKSFLKFKNKKTKEIIVSKEEKIEFVVGEIFLAVLTGLLIPSGVIKSSPQEFINLVILNNPIEYLISSFSIAIGTFVIWSNIFYVLLSNRTKKLMNFTMWLMIFVGIINYLLFSNIHGELNLLLNYGHNIRLDLINSIAYTITILIAFSLITFLIRKNKKILKYMYLTFTIVVVAMSVLNVSVIDKSASNKLENIGEIDKENPQFTFDKNGKNVVVLMMDRAISSYIPYIFNEKPEVKKQFEGFTYYPNTISYGAFTNTGSPALFGGYEYTPEEMNKRDKELLKDKTNEALKVMPQIFSDNGFNVTVCDPVYANYSWIPDLSIYEDIPNVKAYITKGRFNKDKKKNAETAYKSLNRNFFCYGLFRIAPLFLQPLMYSNGVYNQPDELKAINSLNTPDEKISTLTQNLETPFKAKGISAEFMNSYSTLKEFSNMTNLTENGQNNLLIIANETTHEPMLLKEPEYIPSLNVDNTEYELNNRDRYTVDGKTMGMDYVYQAMHYQINVSSMIELGKWLDYLRENDVYDNTKIIIVADHGRNLYQFEELKINGDEYSDDIMFYNPLLMVKDFNSKEFKTDNTFMTNGDVPTIATKDIIENPVNPATGKPINSDYKNSGIQKILFTPWNINDNDGNTYIEEQWYYLEGANALDNSKWIKVPKK